jgi:hypothetical protein
MGEKFESVKITWQLQKLKNKQISYAFSHRRQIKKGYEHLRASLLDLFDNLKTKYLLTKIGIDPPSGYEILRIDDEIKSINDFHTKYIEGKIIPPFEKRFIGFRIFYEHYEWLLDVYETMPIGIAVKAHIKNEREFLKEYKQYHKRFI